MVIVRYKRREKPRFRESTGNFVPVSISIESNYELHKPTFLTRGRGASFPAPSFRLTAKSATHRR